MLALNFSAHAGEPGPGDESFSFVEFARRKLNPPKQGYNVVKTSVIIDGELEREMGENEFKLKDTESSESFIKIKMLGVLSSTSTPEAESKQCVTLDEEAEDGENVDLGEVQNILSIDTQAGTFRTSVKTFKTRSIQTMASDKVEPDTYKNRAIPARFEGTMMTPVYFDGIMITPEKLDVMLTEASKKGDNFSLPIKLQGGMLSTAFKAMSQTDKGDEPVPVKFHGKLQGLLEPNKDGQSVPVTFDGNMRKLK